MNAAKEMFQRQRRYDILHHRMRLEHLKTPSPTWACGTSIAKTDIHNLSLQSRAVLENPALGTHSVDLSDTDYLAELDEFEANP